MSPTPHALWTGRIFPILVLICSVGFTVFTWQLLDHNVTYREMSRFSDKARVDIAAVERKLELYSAAANGAVGLFSASREVEQHEWEAYFEGIELDRFYPGLRRIAYVVRVDSPGLEAHERLLRTSGMEEYAVHPRSGAAEIFPSVFLAPARAVSSQELGLDYSSDPFRARLLARASDGTHITGFASSGPDEGCFIICHVAQNAGRMGWVVAAVEKGAIFAGGMDEGSPDAIRVIAHADASRKSTRVFESNPGTSSQPDMIQPLVLERMVNAAGIPFLMRFESTPGFHAATDRSIPRVILTAGFLISLLLFWITRTLATGRRAALALAERITTDLARSEENYRTLVRNIPGVIYRCRKDKNGKMEFISDGIAEISGYPATEFVSGGARHYAEIVHREDVPLVDRIVHESLSRHEPYILEYRIVNSAGAVRWVYEKGRGVYDESGKLLFLDGAIFDVTSRKILEEQLYQAQKMESVGQLAGGIAHDFNNILMVMQFHSQRVAQLIPEDHDAAHSTEVIQKSTKRATDLTQQLLAFSRRQVLRLVAVDLNAVVASTIRMLTPIITSHVEIVTVFAHEAEPIRADQGLVGQVIVNLAVNARDAMPDGGKLTIETGHETLDVPVSHHFGTLPAGEYGTMIISDTGSGISKEQMPHIFEPFFTTKPLGKGTGLGLSVVYGIIQQHEGGIRCESAPGKGTRFVIHIPASRPGDLRPGQHGIEPEVEALSKQSTVLIVEDNDDVRFIARDVLSRAGCTVLLARDGEDALRIAHAHEGPIHLLFTDIVMPRLGGSELADRLLRMRSDMKVLFTSGYADELIVRHGITRQSMNFIPKPYSESDLLWKVRTILGHGA